LAKIHTPKNSHRHDAPIVVKAFMTHDLATMKQHIGRELEERMAGIFRHYKEAVSHKGFEVLVEGVRSRAMK